MTDSDYDLALLAVRTYASRNSLFHGKSLNLFESRNYADLAKYLEMPYNNLESVIPSTEKPLVGKYRRLVLHGQLSASLETLHL